MFYLDLFRALDAHGVRYAVVGGLAMNLHGVPRLTMDVDLLVDLGDGNLRAFLRAAGELGLKPGVPVPLTDLLDPVRRQTWIDEKGMVAFPMRPPDPTGPTVDLLVAPAIDVQRAIGRAERRDLGGIPVALAAVADLIGLKQAAGRRQDLADIEHLERLSELAGDEARG
jgi:hypothetical protein